MKIDLVFPRLPPALDGVGDHTSLTAQLLTKAGHEVRILCAPGPHAPIPGVQVVPCLIGGLPWAARHLRAACLDHRPDWVVLQFAAFAWGRWGLNPLLAHAIRSLPATQVALLVHEAFPPGGSLRAEVLSRLHQRQLRSLGNRCEKVMFTTEGWVCALRPWFPSADVRHLGIASNLPRSNLSRDQARQALNIGPDEVVVGFFGSLGNHRKDLLLAGFHEATTRAKQVTALYIGASATSFAELVTPLGHRVVTLATPSPDAAADAMPAVDLALAPFVGGVSMRRTSFMAWLQHGVPTVATGGPLVGPQLARAAGKGAFAIADGEDALSFRSLVGALVSDSEARCSMGHRARRTYDEQLDADVASRRLLHILAERGPVAGT